MAKVLKKLIFPQCNLRQVVREKENEMDIFSQASQLQIVTWGRGQVQSEGKRDQNQVSLSFTSVSQPCCKAVPIQWCLGKVPALCNLHFYSSAPRAVNTQCFPRFLLCLLKFQKNITEEHRCGCFAGSCMHPCLFDPLNPAASLNVLPIQYSLIHQRMVSDL